MGREKVHYRETLAYLTEQGYSMSLSKTEAQKILGISWEYLNKLIAKNYIKEVCGKIPLGSVANYICG